MTNPYKDGPTDVDGTGYTRRDQVKRERGRIIDTVWYGIACWMCGLWFGIAAGIWLARVLDVI